MPRATSTGAAPGFTHTRGASEAGGKQGKGRVQGPTIAVSRVQPSGLRASVMPPARRTSPVPTVSPLPPLTTGGVGIGVVVVPGPLGRCGRGGSLSWLPVLFVFLLLLFLVFLLFLFLLLLLVFPVALRATRRIQGAPQTLVLQAKRVNTDPNQEMKPPPTSASLNQLNQTTNSTPQ